MEYFDFEYRIRYGDTDQMGVSYYANYFYWFEAARTEYFRALGILYTDCERQGFFLPVTEAFSKYHASCTYDDLIIVRTCVSHLGRASLRFEYQVIDKKSQKLLATGHTVHAFVGNNRRPVRAPSHIQKLVTPYSLLETK